MTLPEDAPEGMYEIRFISATPTGTGLSVQPSEFRVKVTSSNPLGTQLANTATALGKSNLIIYEDENGSLKKVVPSMGMLYKIPANCTVVSAQQYMYHVQGGSEIVTEAVLFPSLDEPTETVEIKVSARHVSIELPAPRVAVKIFTSREIPALKKKDKDLMEFLKWIAGTKSE